MMSNKAMLLPVNSCDLGKLGSGGLALKLDFEAPARVGGRPQAQSAVFALSRDLAENISNVLARVLDEKADEILECEVPN